MRFPRLAAGAVLAASVALILAGCSGGSAASSGDASGEPVPGGVLAYATDVQPTAGGLDPYVTSAFASHNVLVQIYDTLFTKTDDGEIVPALAESWEQVDGAHIQVTLREDVVFSDGTPLTVDDVVFSFQTMITPGSVQAAYLNGLTGISAVDDRTVEFEFTGPNGAFMNVIAARHGGIIVNKAWYESTSPEDRQRTALGTGPFALDSWDDNVSVNLVRNERYWQEGLPYLDAIEFRILPDENARQSAIRQGGEVQAGWLRDAGLADQLEGEGFSRGQNAATRGLAIYINATGGPLADLRVRQAISLATDRQELIDLGAGGQGELSLFVPAGDPSATPVDDDTPLYTTDVEAAVDLLEDAGYEGGATVTLNYASDASFALDVPVYEVWKEQLAEAGITLNLEGSSWADVVGSYGSSTYTEMVAIPGIYAPDVTSYLSAVMFPDSPRNLGLLEPDSPGVAEFQALYTITDPEERQAKLADVQDLVAENAYMYMLFSQPQRYEVWSQDVQGYDVDPYTYRSKLNETWFAQ